MFTKLIAFVFSATILAAATPVPQVSSSQCSAATLQCCISIEDSSSPPAAAIFALLGIINPGGLAGFQCSPVSVIGLGTTPCPGILACCQTIFAGGLIAFPCVPVTI